MPLQCYEILIETNKIPEAAMFARAYLPSKLDYVIKLWQEKTKDKPFVPTNLADVPGNVPIIDLAIRIEKVLREYYEKEKEDACNYQAAYVRHFQDIAGQVDADEETDLQKPLDLTPSYENNQETDQQDSSHQDENYDEVDN